MGWMRTGSRRSLAASAIALLVMSVVSCLRPAAELDEGWRPPDAGAADAAFDSGGPFDAGTTVPDAGFCPLDGGQEVRLSEAFDYYFDWKFVDGGFSLVRESERGPRFARFSPALQPLGPEVPFAHGGYEGIAHPTLTRLGATNLIFWNQSDGGQDETLFLARLDHEGRMLFTAQADGGAPGYVTEVRARADYSGMYPAFVSVNEQCILLAWTDCGRAWLRGLTVAPNGTRISNVVDLVPFDGGESDTWCNGQSSRWLAPIGSSDFVLGRFDHLGWYTPGSNDWRIIFRRYNCSLIEQPNWERVSPTLKSSTISSHLFSLSNASSLGGNAEDLLGLVRMEDRTLFLWHSTPDGGTLSFIADGGATWMNPSLLLKGRQGPIAVWSDEDHRESFSPRLFAQGVGTPKLELLPVSGGLLPWPILTASLGNGVHSVLMRLDAGSGPDGGGLGLYGKLFCEP